MHQLVLRGRWSSLVEAAILVDRTQHEDCQDLFELYEFWCC